MSQVTRTAGIAGTFTYNLSVTPYAAPVMTVYSDSGRTVVVEGPVVLAATPNPATFTATYLANMAAGTYYLSFSTVLANGQPPLVDANDTLVLVAVTGNVGTVAWPTVADLSALTGIAYDTVKTAQATAALAGAIELVRDEARHRIDYVDADTKALRGNWGVKLWLPEPPVDTSRATAFTIDVPGGLSIVLSSDRYRVRRSGLVERVTAIPPATGRFPMPIFGHWGGDGAEITVTYSHGYPSIPGALRTVVMAAALRAMANPSGRSEQVQADQLGYNHTADSVVWLYPNERKICARYRPQARSAA